MKSLYEHASVSSRLLPVFVLAQILLPARTAQLRSSKSEDNAGFFTYDYSNHGQDWTAGFCSSKTRQSPIDLPATAPQTGVFTYMYHPIMSPIEVMNTGHTFAIDLSGMGYGGIVYDNAWYNLMNVNAHSLSEHTWGGARKPVELHLVHKRYDSDALLIIAIPFEGNVQVPVLLQSNVSSASHLRKSTHAQPVVGMPAPSPSGYTYVEPGSNEQNYNPTLQAFVKMEPPRINMKAVVPPNPSTPFNFNDIMQSASFFEYAGSLTSPPCAEIVTWLVRKDALKASDRQIAYLNDAIYKSTAEFGNYRSLMPVSGRIISMRQSIPDGSSGVPTAPHAGRPEHTEREMQAMNWAVNAMTVAKESTDYVKDLDDRLRNAAQAHAKALTPLLAPPKGLDALTNDAPTTTTFNAGVQYVLGKIKMEDTAKTMTRTLVQPPYQDMTIAAKAAAMSAARAATEKIPIYPSDLTSGMILDPTMLRYVAQR
jgi:carbonic anhydrase|mmetsp:Transcript_85781/g.135487  ORF Transcript_85781/g.135487 Transcript_85781/m.135487 type:complete len:481 (+) Transcript_85781:66-1508(+)